MRVEDLAEKEGIHDMVDGEPLSRWELGSTILPEHAVEEVTPPLEDENMQPRGTWGTTSSSLMTKTQQSQTI